MRNKNKKKKTNIKYEKNEKKWEKIKTKIKEDLRLRQTKWEKTKNEK